MLSLQKPVCRRLVKRPFFFCLSRLGSWFTHWSRDQLLRFINWFAPTWVGKCASLKYQPSPLLLCHCSGLHINPMIGDEGASPLIPCSWLMVHAPFFFRSWGHYRGWFTSMVLTRVSQPMGQIFPSWTSYYIPIQIDFLRLFESLLRTTCLSFDRSKNASLWNPLFGFLV